MPSCCFCVWTLLALFIYSVGIAVPDGIQRLKRLHQIPCSRCAYFTGEYCLKCTVHPSKALSENAIDCLDFEQASARNPTLQPCRQTCINTQSSLTLLGQC